MKTFYFGCPSELEDELTVLENEQTVQMNMPPPIGIGNSPIVTAIAPNDFHDCVFDTFEIQNVFT